MSATPFQFHHHHLSLQNQSNQYTSNCSSNGGGGTLLCRSYKKWNFNELSKTLHSSGFRSKDTVDFRRNLSTFSAGSDDYSPSNSSGDPFKEADEADSDAEEEDQALNFPEVDRWDVLGLGQAMVIIFLCLIGCFFLKFIECAELWYDLVICFDWFLVHCNLGRRLGFDMSCIFVIDKFALYCAFNEINVQVSSVLVPPFEFVVGKYKKVDEIDIWMK